LPNLDVAAALVINCLYMKKFWKYSFAPNLNTYNTFTNSNGKTSKVQFMRKTFEGLEDVLYYEDNHLQYLALPYGNENNKDDLSKGKDDCVFEIFLPTFIRTSPNCVESTIQRLEPDYLRSIRESAKPGVKVSLELPKFKFNFNLKLKDVLMKLNMKEAFDPSKANFSKMFNSQVYIMDVFHFNFIDVNEFSTEAASSTVVFMSKCKMSHEPQEKNLVANRPFIIAIRDKNQEEALFLGKVKNLNNE